MPLITRKNNVVLPPTCHIEIDRFSEQAKDLVACWPAIVLGDRAVDLSVYQQSTKSMSYGNIQNRLSFGFDSTNYMDLGNHKKLQIARGTLITWFNFNAGDLVYFAVDIPYDDGADWDAPYVGIGLGAQQPFNVANYWLNINGTNEEFTNNVSLSSSTWYQLALTYDGTIARGYINGVQDTTKSVSGNITYSGSPSLVLGNRSKQAPGEGINGYVGETRLYNRVLTAKQIEKTYNPLTRDNIYVQLNRTTFFFPQAAQGTTYQGISTLTNIANIASKASQTQQSNTQITCVSALTCAGKLILAGKTSLVSKAEINSVASANKVASTNLNNQAIIKSVAGNTILGASSLINTAILQSIGSVGTKGIASLSCQSQISCAGKLALIGKTSFISKAEIIAVAGNTILGASTLVNKAITQPIGSVGTKASTNLISVSVLSTVGSNNIRGNASLVSKAEINSTAKNIILGTSTLLNTAILRSTGSVASKGVISLNTNSIITSIAGNTILGKTNLVNVSIISSLASVATKGSTTLNANAIITGIASSTKIASANLNNQSILKAIAGNTILGTSRLINISIISSQANLLKIANTFLTSQSIIRSGSTLNATGQTNLLSKSILTSAGNISSDNKSHLHGITQLNSIANVTRLSITTITSTSQLTGIGANTYKGIANLNGISTLLITPRITSFAKTNININSILSGISTLNKIGSTNLNNVSLLTSKSSRILSGSASLNTSATANGNGRPVKIGRPDADISTGTWTVTPLWSKLDEIYPDDTDLITSAVTPINDICEVSLSDVTDPLTSDNHFVQYRYSKDSSGGQNIHLTVSLIQGTTIIASWIHSNISDSWVQAKQTLTSGEADSITDYNNLRLRFEADSDVGTLRAAKVSWAEFEVPVAQVQIGNGIILGQSVINSKASATYASKTNLNNQANITSLANLTKITTGNVATQAILTSFGTIQRNTSSALISETKLTGIAQKTIAGSVIAPFNAVINGIGANTYIAKCNVNAIANLNILSTKTLFINSYLTNKCIIQSVGGVTQSGSSSVQLTRSTLIGLGRKQLNGIVYLTDNGVIICRGTIGEINGRASLSCVATIDALGTFAPNNIFSFDLYFQRKMATPLYFQKIMKL